MRPLISLENYLTKDIISIYDDGKVYGKKHGELLGTLCKESKIQIFNLIKDNIYMFKTEVVIQENLNPIILRVRDDSRKKRNIMIIGWRQIPQLLIYMSKTENLHEHAIRFLHSISK